MNRKRYSSPSRFIVSFFRLKKIVLVIYLKKHTVKNVFSLKKIHIRNGNAQCALSIVLYDFFMGHEIAFIYSIVCMYVYVTAEQE